MVAKNFLIFLIGKNGQLVKVSLKFLNYYHKRILLFKKKISKILNLFHLKNILKKIKDTLNLSAMS